MTLDMLEILVDAGITALSSIDDIEHWVGILLIFCALSLGSAYAFSILVIDYFFKKIKRNYLSKVMQNSLFCGII